MSEDLRYPVGKFDSGREVAPELRREFIQTIADLPSKIRHSNSCSTAWVYARHTDRRGKRYLPFQFHRHNITLENPAKKTEWHVTIPLSSGHCSSAVPVCAGYPY